MLVHDDSSFYSFDGADFVASEAIRLRAEGEGNLDKLSRLSTKPDGKRCLAKPKNLNRHVLVSLDQSILDTCPEAEIGFLIAEVSVRKELPYVEEMKKELLRHMHEQGIEATNFVAHPSIACWRSLYETIFQVKPKQFRSSIESLIRRIVMGKQMWQINSVVDLYNCCSVLSLLPMGGYDLDKISGDIEIRYALPGETFCGLGAQKAHPIEERHIVYADQHKVLCWLWNHKDAAETAIDLQTKRVVFFVDSLHLNRVESALNLLEKELEKIGCSCLSKGILNRSNAVVSLC